MSVTIILKSEKSVTEKNNTTDIVHSSPVQPTISQLQTNLGEASRLVDDIVLKKIFTSSF